MMASTFKDIPTTVSIRAAATLTSTSGSNPSFSSTSSGGPNDESSSVQSSSENKSIMRKKSTPTNQTPKLSRKERLASLAQKERALIDALPSLIGEKSLLFGGVSAKLNSGKLSNTDDNSKRFVNRKESLKEYPPLTSQKSPAAASPKLPVVQAPIVTPPAVVVVSAEERLKEVEQPPTKSALSKSQFYPQNGTEYTGSTIFAIDIAKRALNFIAQNLTTAYDPNILDSVYSDLQQILTKLDEIKKCKRSAFGEDLKSRLHQSLALPVEDFTTVHRSQSEDILVNIKPSVPYQERKEAPPEELIILWSESSSEDEAINEPPKTQSAATSTTTPKKSWADIVSITKTPLAKVLTLEKIEEKLSRAEEARLNFSINRARRLQTVDEKIREARYNREKERSEAQKRLQERLNRAQDRRTNILQSKSHRTREDREKQKADSMQKLQTQKIVASKERQAKAEARQKELEEERLRKLEESAAKNEAALARRSVLEQERLAKLQTIEEKRRELEQRKQQERLVLLAAREAEKEEKARRLAEFKSEKEENTEELRKVISDRIEKVSKRHEELLEQVKEKAAAITEHSREVAERTQALRKSKVCLVCKEEIFTDDESSRKKRDHVHSFESIFNQDQNGDEAVRPKQKGKKKKMEKKKAALAQLSAKDLLAAVRRRLHEFNIDSTVENFNELDTTCIAFEARIQQDSKFSREKLLNRDDIFSMGLALQKLDSVDNLFSFGWISYTISIFQSFYSHKLSAESPEATLICDPKYLNPIIDGVFHAISKYALPKCQACGTDEYLALVTKCTEFMRLCLGQKTIDNRIKQSIIDHVASSKCLHALHDVFATVHGPLDPQSNQPLIAFISSVLGFLFDSTELLNSGTLDGKLFLNEIRNTELVGLVMLLDSVLLYPGNSKNVASTADELPLEIVEIVTLAVRVLNNIARVDLKTLQIILGKDPSAANQEVMSVLQTEFFHFLRFCLQYCTNELSSLQLQTPAQAVALLNEVIVLIGYYVRENPSNQCLLRFGQYPVILQLLARLPLAYFCNPRLQYILFPTLMLACHRDEDNLMILGQELSLEHLLQFFRTHVQLSRDQTADSLRRKLMDDLDRRYPKFAWRQALDALKP